jgi:Zn-dependent M28 family amino/carboxypeptidase
VIGAKRGTTDEWIVIGAHYDHLGVRKGEIYNGADDNASGVAVLLDIASRVGRSAPLRRGFLFCSFDAEEDGLVGSTHFVNSELYPIASIAAMICFDLVGGSFLPGDEGRVFALGSESSSELFEWIGKARDAARAFQLERVGIYAIEPAGPIFARSDYSPFRLKKVPFVFFSTGTPWYYHTPQDDVERLDFRKMTFASDVAWALSMILAGTHRPTWRTPAPDRREDARLLAAGCRRVLENPVIRTSDRQRAAVASALENLTKAAEAETDSKDIAPVVQHAMMVLFEVAKGQKR